MQGFDISIIEGTTVSAWPILCYGRQQVVHDLLITGRACLIETADAVSYAHLPQLPVGCKHENNDIPSSCHSLDSFGSKTRLLIMDRTPQRVLAVLTYSRILSHLAAHHSAC